jgi:class 3 adenylate cyclase
MSSNDPIAVQFSDLRGFSSFTAQHGDEEAFRMATQFVELVGTKVEEHGGCLLKTYGDGVMTSFGDPSQAVRSAVAMQGALLKTYDGGEADKTVISAGIGLTWGTAIRTDGDLFGHSVNLAKRLADEAKGGQIVTSSSLIDATGPLEGCTFRSMGERSLKGVGAHRLYEVVWRPEIMRLQTVDQHMDIILTDDGTVVVELGKYVQRKLDDVVQQLESEAEDKSDVWLARFIKRHVAKGIAKSLPTWVDWAQSRAGLGIEHPVGDVRAEIVDGKLLIFLGREKKPLSFDRGDIDPADAQAFMEQLERMKASD